MWERKQKPVGLISSTSSWPGVYRLLFCLFMATYFHQGVFGDRKMDEVAGGTTAISLDPPAHPTSSGPFPRRNLPAFSAPPRLLHPTAHTSCFGPDYLSPTPHPQKSPMGPPVSLCQMMPAPGDPCCIFTLQPPPPSH